MSYGFYEYISISDKRDMAESYLKKHNKKGELSPIIIDGAFKPKNWWGKAWCENLKKYADYDNRVSRGKSYVKNGFIIDLQISTCLVSALVQGRSRKPYQVNIYIDECNKDAKDKLKKVFKNFDNIDELLSGNFPKTLGQEFLESSLFPTHKEIKFNCSCPDYASLCKHISGVLYGIGAKLDKNPELLFSLRGIKIEDMIAKKLKSDVKKITTNKNKTKRKVIEEENINELFNID